MTWRGIPTSLYRDPVWLGLSAEARSLYVTLRLHLGRTAIGITSPGVLEALSPGAGAGLDELIEAKVVSTERLITGEVMVWLRRWALGDDPSMRGAKNATGVLRAIEDLPVCQLLADWCLHHRTFLEASSDWQLSTDRLSDRLSDRLPDRASSARGREGNHTETERETSTKGSLAPATSPDSAREAAGPDGPPRPLSVSPDDAFALTRTLADAGVDVPLSRRVPKGPATMSRQDQLDELKRRRAGRQKAGGSE